MNIGGVIKDKFSRIFDRHKVSKGLAAPMPDSLEAPADRFAPSSGVAKVLGPTNPPLSLHDASRKAVKAYAAGACSVFPELRKVPDQMEEILSDLLSAHPDSETSEALIAIARGSRRLAPVAVGALLEGASPQGQLLTGLAMLASWTPDRDALSREPLFDFPTGHAVKLLSLAAEQTGDQALRGALFDTSRENLMELSGSVLRSNGITSREVLGLATVPLTDAILREVGSENRTRYNNNPVAGHYTEGAELFFNGNGDRPALESFWQGAYDHADDIQKLWDAAKAEYPERMPELTRKLEQSPVQLRAKAGLWSREYESGLRAVTPFVLGAEAELIELHQGTRGQGIFVDTPRSPYTPDEVMAKSLLLEIAQVDSDSDVSVLARTGLRLEGLAQRETHSPLPKSSAWTIRSAAILEALSKKALTPAQRLMLETNLENPADYHLAFLYLARPQSDEVPQAALKGALVSAGDLPGHDHALLTTYANLSQNSVEKAVAGLSVDDGHRGLGRQRALAAGLLLSQSMKEADKEHFLERLGLQLILSDGAQPPSLEGSRAFLSLGHDGLDLADADLERLRSVAAERLASDSAYDLDFIAHVRDASALVSRESANLSKASVELWEGSPDLFDPIENEYPMKRTILGAKYAELPHFQTVWAGRTVQEALFVTQ